MRRLMFILAVAGLALIGSGPPAGAEGGPVWGWGLNDWGQVGDGTYTNTASPVKLYSFGSVTRVAMGELHGLALKSDGTLWAWGTNWNGRLGDGTAMDRRMPVQVVGLSAVRDMCVGGSHSVALDAAGNVWAWGRGYEGQLGNGTNDDRNAPIQVVGLTAATAVAAGWSHTIALKSDGTVWAWGDNSAGQIGDGTTNSTWTPVQVGGLSDVTAIAANGNHCLAVKSDGTVWAWGMNNAWQLGIDGGNQSSPIQVVGITNATSVGAGFYHSLARLDDGTALAWGANWNGQLGDGTTNWTHTPVVVSGVTGVVAVAGGESHSIALTSRGKLHAWGNNSEGQLGDGSTTNRLTPVVVNGLIRVAAIGTFHSNCAAAKQDGTVWSWGDNSNGQLGDGSAIDRNRPVQVGTLSNVTAVSGGMQHSLGLTDDGLVWGWGSNSLIGQLGLWSSLDYPIPTPNPYIPPATGISTFTHHGFANIAGGGTMAWSWNVFGQLGDGSDTSWAGPTWVIDSSTGNQFQGFTSAKAGHVHSVAVRTDGSVWAWGNNWYGQLGDGTIDDRWYPTQVQDPSDPTGFLTGVVAVSGGYFHTLALKADGTVWAWGSNWGGQLGDGSTTDRWTPVKVQGLDGVHITSIAAGFGNNYAVSSAGGQVYGWGYNEYGSVGDGTVIQRATAVPLAGLAGVTAVAAPGWTGLALKSDGTVWAWGAGWYGQMGDGTYRWPVPTPQQVPGLPPCQGIGGGHGHILAIERANVAPMASDQAITAKSGIGKPFVLNIADGNGHPLNYTALSGPSNGSLAGTAPDLVYTSAPTFSGSDSFTYVADDGMAESDPATVTITVEAPVPVAMALSPALAGAGSGPINLRVRGTGFVHSSVVLWNGNPRTVTSVTPKVIECTIPASDLANPGSALVSVLNPGPGGGTSNSLRLNIGKPAIEVLSVVVTKDVGGALRASFKVKNVGAGIAKNTRVTVATLRKLPSGGALAASGLPLTLGDLSAGMAAIVSPGIEFPSIAANVGDPVVVVIGGAFTGGSFNSTTKTTVVGGKASGRK